MAIKRRSDRTTTQREPVLRPLLDVLGKSNRKIIGDIRAIDSAAELVDELQSRKRSEADTCEAQAELEL